MNHSQMFMNYSQMFVNHSQMLASEVQSFFCKILYIPTYCMCICFMILEASCYYIYEQWCILYCMHVNSNVRIYIYIILCMYGYTYMYVCMCIHTHANMTMNYLVTAGGEKGGTGVRVHTLDRYGKPIM